jgi:hypothetical protein
VRRFRERSTAELQDRQYPWRPSGAPSARGKPLNGITVRHFEQRRRPAARSALTNGLPTFVRPSGITAGRLRISASCSSV